MTILQKADTELIKSLIKKAFIFRMTPIVDDDFPAIRDDFDQTLNKAVEIFGVDIKCPFELKQSPTISAKLSGRCILKVGHEGACTNGTAIWTDPNNY